MSRKLSRTILVVAGLLVTTAAMRSSTGQKSDGSSNLQPLAFLAGSCWKGTFVGRAVTDEHCFTWMYGGRFLRDRHVVRGDSVPYEGETTYAWDAERKQIVYWYVALPGFYSEGTVDTVDGALSFRDKVITSTPRQLRTLWRRSGGDAYTVRVEEVNAGSTKMLWSMVLQRSRPAPQ